MAFSPTGLLFTGAAALSALGAGTRPAMQSLALDAYTRQGGTEAGRLFGALSVLQALGTSVLGPLLFGLVYACTVGWVPQALFVAAAALPALTFALLSFLRPRKDSSVRAESPSSENDGDAQDERTPLLDPSA